MQQHRPNPEMLLKEYNLTAKTEYGKLKIFFGYAAGVGKTYAMLIAAHHALGKGIDVVAGYVEPHKRSDTAALMDGLEQLPLLSIQHKGITISEFNLDAALKRKPQLVLVDELAHTNASGCRHKKRYQDVEELLRAGIDVYSTLNVQHLESLNDLVSSITGIIVQERVPDSVFDSAEQIELVDIPPAELLKRLAEGKIYSVAQAQKAGNNFFTLANLTALREIAMRRTADQLSYISKLQLSGSKNVSEHVMTCLSSSPSNAKVIRTAARMAEVYQCNFTALFVETTLSDKETEENKKRLRANINLAESLGARISTVYGDDIAEQIVTYANSSGITKIVLGRTNTRHSIFTKNKSLIDRLAADATNLEIHIIPDSHAKPYKPPSKPFKVYFKVEPLDILKSLAITSTATLIGLAFYNFGVAEANIIIVYILGVLLNSMCTSGNLIGIIISVLNVLVFNYFFTEPRFTLQAYDPNYVITFSIMFISAFLTNRLAARVKMQAQQAAQKSYRTEILLKTSQLLQKAQSEKELLAITAGQLQKLLDRPVFFYTAGSNGLLMPPLYFDSSYKNIARSLQTAEEMAVAQWVFNNGKQAGATTNTLSSAKCYYLAVRAQNQVFAVAGIYINNSVDALSAFEKNMLFASLGECGLAFEKEYFAEQKRNVESKAQTEELRANLLRSISHDLRTPLTSISGNAGVLLNNSVVLTDMQKHGLYKAIYDDSMWLINLVENLLAVTRLEHGNVNLKLQDELLEDIINEALAHLDPKAAEYTLKTVIEDELLMVSVDARLIVQLIINIVNNAIKYTPSNSEINLSAKAQGKQVLIEIADNGSGISDSDKEHLFEMFFTINKNSDGRRGLGLGLSLCKSIVAAHNGTISVRDNNPHGTIISFTLPKAEVIIHE